MQENQDIKSIRNLIVSFTESIIQKEKTEPEFANMLRGTVESMVNLLYKIERLDKAVYEDMLIAAGIDKSKLTVLNLDNNLEKYIEENILLSKDKDKINQYESLMSTLDEALKDPKNINEETLENWIKNYKEFIIQYQLNEELMLDNFKDKLLKAGFEDKKIEEYIEIYKNTKVDLEQDEPGKENPDEPGKENPDKPGKDNPDKPGKDNPDKPGKENPDEPGKENPDEPENDEVDKSNEPLKIVSVKYTKKEKWATIGSVIASWSIAPITLPAVLIANLGYNLYKKKQIRKTVESEKNVYEIDKEKIESFKEFLEEKGLAVNENGILVDAETGVEITEATVEAERFKYIKEQLINLKPTKKSKFNLGYQLSKFRALLTIDKDKNKEAEEVEEETITRGGR